VNLVNAPVNDTACTVMPDVIEVDAGVRAEASRTPVTVDPHPASVAPKAVSPETSWHCGANRNVLLAQVATMLREQMRRQGISLKTLAQRMGRCSTGSVSRLVSGNNNVTLSTIADVATALGKRLTIALVDDDPRGTSHIRTGRSIRTTWDIVLSNLDTRQTLLYLPPDLASLPAAYLAEFTQIRVDMLALAFVDPNRPMRDRRYQVVRHHGSLSTSVPKPWLRDQARAGDSLRVTRQGMLSFTIELIRAPRD
jgi:transcriptional regulator with XRE-family HTH domain